MKSLLFPIIVASLVLIWALGILQAKEGDYFPIKLFFVSGECVPNPGGRDSIGLPPDSCSSGCWDGKEILCHSQGGVRYRLVKDSVSQRERELYAEIKANWMCAVPSDSVWIEYASEPGVGYKLPIGDDPLGKRSLQELSTLADNYLLPPDNLDRIMWEAAVDTVITRIHRIYGGYPAFWGYVVAHEKPELEYPQNLPGILGYICRRIHEIDPDHESLAYGLSTLTGCNTLDEFLALIDSLDENEVPTLDVLPAYCYPFGTSTPYAGPGFQAALGNQISHYQLAMESLRDRSPEWWAGFQVDYGTDGDYRPPTATEVRCQAYLGLSRGARGIMYFTYHSNPPNYNGIVTFEGPRQHNEFSPGGVTYDVFNVVKSLNQEFLNIGPLMLDFYPVMAFNSREIPDSSYIKSITGDQVINDKGTIEVGIFRDTTVAEIDADYFMLVNRVCNNDSGSPTNPQTVTVTIQGERGAPYRITDVLTEEDTVITADVDEELQYVKTLDAGDGRLMHLELDCNIVYGHITQDTTWQSQKMTLVRGDVTVNSGVTLTIEPGARIEFDTTDVEAGGQDVNRCELIINGTLDAQGNDSAWITFTSYCLASHQPQDWYGIRFVGQSSSNSVMKHCHVKYASTGIHCHSASPTVTQNHIESCEFGIYCIASSSPLIERNVIVDNGIPSESGAGIYSVNSSPIIQNNTIEGNFGLDGGLFLMNTLRRYEVVKNNIIVENFKGIKCSCFWGATISYNDVWENTEGDFVGCDDDLGVMADTNANGDSCDIYFNIILNPSFVQQETLKVGKMVRQKVYFGTIAS